MFQITKGESQDLILQNEISKYQIGMRFENFLQYFMYQLTG